MRVSGWPGFLLWGLVGGIYGIAYLGMMSIGIYILIVAIVTTIVATRQLRVWPEILGLAAGPAVVMMRVAQLSWHVPRCGPGEQPHFATSASGVGNAATGAYSETVHFSGCTDLAAGPLLWSAITLSAAALIAYVLLRYYRPPVPRQS
jgi:hypothetical protein